MHLFKMFLVNLIIVKSFSCLRINLEPFLEEIEIRDYDFIRNVSKFIEKALIKLEKGTLDENDLEKLIFFTHYIIELKKQYKTPPVYWASRKG
jgi:hypothetical protein